MTDQSDTYLSHYPNATHHTTSDTNMSFIEINTKKQFKLHIHTTVPSALQSVSTNKCIYNINVTMKNGKMSLYK